MTPQESAVIEARAHGLVGRPDSPADWQQILEGGQPGAPILVKDPDDSRDDFYLVPIYAKDPTLRRSAWVMLDPITLRLREASLLDNWMVPAFPTDSDAEKISSEQITLPDGTKARFKKSELRPNQRNLVWKASAASILPYWPLREFIAPHPTTGAPTSIYVTQHGKIYAALLPDELPASPSAPPTAPPQKPAQNPTSPPKSILSKALVPLCGILTAAVAGLIYTRPHPTPPPTEIPKINEPVKIKEPTKIVETPDKPDPEIPKLHEKLSEQIQINIDLTETIGGVKKKLVEVQEELTKGKAKHPPEIEIDLKPYLDEIARLKALLANPKTPPHPTDPIPPNDATNPPPREDPTPSDRSPIPKLPRTIKPRAIEQLLPNP